MLGIDELSSFSSHSGALSSQRTLGPQRLGAGEDEARGGRRRRGDKHAGGRRLMEAATTNHRRLRRRRRRRARHAATRGKEARNSRRGHRTAAAAAAAVRERLASRRGGAAVSRSVKGVKKKKAQKNSSPRQRGFFGAREKQFLLRARGLSKKERERESKEQLFPSSLNLNRIMSGGKGIGIPVKLLHEAAGHVVTVRRGRGKKRNGTLSIVKLSADGSSLVLPSVDCEAFASSLCRSPRIAAGERSELLTKSRFQRSTAGFRASGKSEERDRFGRRRRHLSATSTFLLLSLSPSNSPPSPPPLFLKTHIRCRLIPSQVELKSGETFRGDLAETEDCWNLQLRNVTSTARDGRVAHLEHVFVRGGRVRLLVVPEMLKHSPMFKRIADLSSSGKAEWKAAAAGRGGGGGKGGGAKGRGGGGRGRGKA